MPVVYESVAAFSKWVHIATSFCMIFQNLFEMFKRFEEAPRIVDLQLGAPTPQNVRIFWDFTGHRIKQIRAFVGFILQPESKLPKNRPRPMNKYRKR